MLYRRWVLLSGFLLYSIGVIGQEVKFEFGTAHVVIQDINKKAEHQLAFRTNGDDIYDLSGGVMYRHKVKILKNYPLNLLWWLTLQYKELDFKRTQDKLVIPASRDVYKLKSTLGDIASNLLSAKRVIYIVDSVHISSVQDTVREYYIGPWRNANVFLNSIESKLNTLNVRTSILGADLSSTYVDSLFLCNVELKKIEISNSPLPHYILLNGITCKDESSQFDLTQFQITDSTKDCDLNIGVGSANHIKANYKYFNLVFDSATSVYDKERVYAELLSMQRANYFLDGYEKLDKEYKAFRYRSRGTFITRVQNWIDKHWWDYGYDKFKVIVNSFKLFLLFFGINLLAYKRLIEVYHPEKFKLFDEELDNSYIGFENPAVVKMKRTVTRMR